MAKTTWDEKVQAMRQAQKEGQARIAAMTPVEHAEHEEKKRRQQEAFESLRESPEWGE